MFLRNTNFYFLTWLIEFLYGWTLGGTPCLKARSPGRMGRQAISTKSAALILTQFKLRYLSFLVPHNGRFLFYIIQKLWSLFVFKFVEYVLIFQIVLFKIVICTQKRILNSILIDVSVQKQKDASYFFTFSDKILRLRP